MLEAAILVVEIKEHDIIKCLNNISSIERTAPNIRKISSLGTIKHNSFCLRRPATPC
jgi:hypothetical protein